MSSGLTEKPPRGLLRLFLRMPILLYRAHLGWLLDGRFLMLTHIGRYSGLPRQVVLEVVHNDSENGAYFVAVGWRGHADWFLNIMVNSAVQVNVGRQVFKATAEVVEIIEAVAVFYVYACRHPFAFQELTQLMLNEKLQPDQEDCFRLAESVPLVKLTPIHPADKETS